MPGRGGVSDSLVPKISGEAPVARAGSPRPATGFPGTTAPGGGASGGDLGGKAPTFGEGAPPSWSGIPSSTPNGGAAGGSASAAASYGSGGGDWNGGDWNGDWNDGDWNGGSDWDSCSNGSWSDGCNPGWYCAPTACWSSWNCGGWWNPCGAACWSPCGWYGGGGWYGSGWGVGVSFGGGGWGVGFGFGGGGWGVSVGFSSGWYGGYGYGGWGGCGYGAWSGCWSPCYAGWYGGGCGWWPYACSTWYAPWYCGAYYVPSPVVYSYPAYAPLIAAPVVYDSPIVYTPSIDWPGYESLDGSTQDPAMLAANTAAPSTAPVDLSVALPPADLDEQEAWDLLSNGREAIAQEQFAQVLNAEPDNARARAGFGLAAALAGHQATAAWALRDALEIRPDVLDFLPLMPSLRSRLTDLARQLELRGTQPSQPNAVDELFLAAALRAAVGDRAQAAYAMEQAARRGTLDQAKADFRARLATELESGL